MKLLYLTDSHLKASTPRFRKDSYAESILSKLEESFKIAKKENVDFILHGGDLFDNTPTYGITNRLTNLLSDIEKPFYLVVGNHDMKGCTYDHSVLPILNLLSNVTVYYTSDYLAYYTMKDPHNIWYLECCPYSSIKGSLRVNPKPDMYMLTTHSMLVDEYVPWDHTLCEDFSKETEADLVLCSHYHKPFDVTYNGTRFVNPGSLARVDAIDYNLHRVPKVAIIHVDKNNYTVEYQELSCHKEVFDLKILEDIKNQKVDLEKFMNSLQEAKFSSINIGEQIIKYGKDNKVDEDVVQEALRRVSNEKR